MPTTNCCSLFASTQNTVCSVSSDPFYIVTYYIRWVTTSWTYSKYCTRKKTFKQPKSRNLVFFQARVESRNDVTKLNVPCLWLLDRADHLAE